jgi:hypothetical protein
VDREHLEVGQGVRSAGEHDLALDVILEAGVILVAKGGVIPFYVRPFFFELRRVDGCGTGLAEGVGLAFCRGGLVRVP